MNSTQGLQNSKKETLIELKSSDKQQVQYSKINKPEIKKSSSLKFS
jgi:hypothetical protein